MMKVILLGLFFLSSCVGGDDPSPTSNACQNVDILRNFAIGACGDRLKIVELASLQRSEVNISGDDISIDPNLSLGFLLSTNLLTMIDLSTPTSPSIIQQVSVNFSSFSGVSAANGIVVVSGGARGSNARAFSYDRNSLNLITDGIPEVDANTGTPDVTVMGSNGGVFAFFSQDLGAVRNWGIWPVEITSTGVFFARSEPYRLASGSVPINNSNFTPSNFPVESEFLDGKLYVASYASNGIEVIDLLAETREAPISLGERSTHVATDGESLFVLSSVAGTLRRIDPETRENFILMRNLENATGLAVDENHIVIADRTEGILVFEK